MFPMRARMLAPLIALSAFACEGDVLVGQFEPATESSSGGATFGSANAVGITSVGGTSASTTGAAGSMASQCQVTQCQGRIYDCGNCEDDDGDGLVDAEDPECVGPCHNAEDTYYGSIPGQSGGSCTRDCYFDRDSGAGNDGCEWDHRCDSREPTPNACPYATDATVGAPPKSCSALLEQQAEQCLDTCLPLVPNGCDCFGCCDFGGPTPVWLGSELDGAPSCSGDALADPERCKPCTQAPSCLNPCEECELCVGKHELPASCGSTNGTPVQRCPADAQPCGLTGQGSCPQDNYCITGCCVVVIK